MPVRATLLLLVVSLFGVPAAAQETGEAKPPAKNEADATDPARSQSMPLTQPFPQSKTIPDALKWIMYARSETAKAMRAARARGDGDRVARLLVLMEDIRRHSGKEAARLLPGPKPAK